MATEVIQIVAGTAPIIVQVPQPGPQGPAGTLSVTTGAAPASSADAIGVLGQVRADASFLYVKTASGWLRAALSSF